MLHGGVVHKNPYYQSLMQSNVYHFLPVVNPDGMAFIEKEFPKNQKISIKRKNMNPDATFDMKGKKKIECSPEQTGVDLNRNYGVDFGVDTRLGSETEDECHEVCSECYRGTEAFSEKET